MIPSLALSLPFDQPPQLSPWKVCGPARERSRNEDVSGSRGAIPNKITKK